MSTRQRKEPGQVSGNLRKWLAIAPELVLMREKAYAEETEDNGLVICPPKYLCFAALDAIAPEDVRVVILGQDPYHHVGKARGVAFGYHPDYRGPINSSLLNIITEAGGDTADFDRSLEQWSRQGVLLLNTRLTVEAEKPMSHAGIGWESIVQKILLHLAVTRLPVFLTWGAEAREMVNAIDTRTTCFVNHITTSHPTRYSATRESKHAPAFLGSNCFSLVNELLKLRSEEEIQWV